jgi:acetylornithine deacetylase/succinyl-diaminopimelate desuccinylase-like protein
VARGASGNVYCRIGGPGPAVVFAAHLDTVFPAETSIEPEQRDDGRILAPGFADNSLGLAGLLLLARKLVGAEMQTPVLLVATVGEEGLGNLRGAREILEREEVREFIAIEGIGLRDLVCSGPGSVRWRISASGPGGHSWSSRGQESAVESLVNYLGIVATMRNDDLAVNIGQIRGGTGPSVIAAEAEALLEIRSLDPGQLERGEHVVLDVLGRVEERSELDWKVESLGRRPGGQGEKGELYRDLIRIREELGVEGEEIALSTDANIAYAQGVPAVAIGLAEGGALHSLEEWCDPARLPEGLDLLLRLAQSRCQSSQ